MKKRLIKITLIFLISLSTFYARRGATMPYIRYEAENGNYGNGVIKLGPTYEMTNIASEAANRECVRLESSGAYVEWTVEGAANGLNLRFSLPDDPNGGGQEGSLSLYIDGNKVKNISLTSKWAWQYFNIGGQNSGEPSNNPADGEPRMRFDEVHFKLPNQVSSGDVIQIRKDNSDGLDYTVDFIELESVPEPISKPTGYLSVVDYGATPDDGNNDAAEIEDCINDAINQGTGVYFPPGRFIMDDTEGTWNGKIQINSSIDIQGAGMWHTRIYFANSESNGAGIDTWASNVTVRDLYLNSATTNRTADNTGLGGTYGTGSIIENVWMEHFEVGIWTADYKGPDYTITDGLEVRNCRIRNVYADGINFAKGSSNNIAENINFRNCLDDAMASWSSNTTTGADQEGTNNTFRYNTVENQMRASGVGFYGGTGHKAHHLVIKDNYSGPGLRISTTFPAFSFGTLEYHNLHNITLIGCGTTRNLGGYRWGAIDLNFEEPQEVDPYNLQYVKFDSIDIKNAQHDAIFVHSWSSESHDKVLKEVYLKNISIDGTAVAKNVNNGPQYFDGSGETGGHGIYAADYSAHNDFTGWIAFEGEFKNIAGDKIAYHNCKETFEIRLSGDAAVNGVIISDDTLIINKGESYNLDVNVEPADAANNVSWNSTNSAVASVNTLGEVTGKGIGEAKIIVTTEEGNYKDTCNVTVTKKTSDYPGIIKTNSNVTIDKNIEETWDDAPTFAIDNVAIGSRPSDFDGYWRGLFNGTSMYILVEVSDTSLNNDSGTEWWNDDAVELYMDGDNSKNSSYDGENDFQLGFRWNDDEVNVGGNSVSNISGIKFTQYQTNSGYNLEVKIPWNTIGVNPEVGDTIGFDVAVDDDDGGGSRDAQIVSISSSDQLWADPSLFGEVKLKESSTAVDNNQNSSIPQDYHIKDNYPNPFNPQTSIEYSLPEPVHVKLQVYNIKGHLVEKLVDEYQNANRYQIKFNAHDLSSGIYFYRIQAGSFNDVKRMLLIK